MYRENLESWTNWAITLQIEYPPFEKNFYDEHEEITSLTPQQVVELRHKLNLRVSRSQN